MRARTAFVAIALVAGGLVATATRVDAAFHLMKVREVFAGQTLQVEADFVELQMYANGQQVVGGHILKFYDQNGTVMDCEIPQNVTNGTNQETILFATVEAQAAFGTADFTIPSGMLHANQGAVCFEDIDCVAWGSFNGPTTSPYGTPESGIPLDQSIDRRTDIAPGAGTLEPGDDTNDSANDFEPDAESANANGLVDVNKGITPCQPGTATSIGPDVKRLKAKKQGAKVLVTGRIEPPAAGEKVTLTLFANGSPMQKAGKKKDTLDADSEFRKRLRVPRDSTRCRVTVRYEGDLLGKKTFSC